MKLLANSNLGYKNILVTGGAGFIGSNLVDRLVLLNNNVTVLDNLFTGKLENIDSLADINFINGSVTDSSLVNELVSKADIIFHLAAGNIMLSTENPDADFQVNVGGTLNVLLAAKKYNVEKIVFVSSASVYGNAINFPIQEETNLRPLSPYAASKISAENYCVAFYESFEIPVTILRFSNVYGIKQNPINKYCGVIAKFFDCIANNYPLKIYGNGEQTRDFTHIDDTIDAAILTAISPKAIGEVYNISSGKETSIKDLAKLALQIAGKDLELEHIKPRVIDNINRRELSTEKIRKSLHWSPNISLESGLKKTYEWFNSINPNLFKEELYISSKAVNLFN